MSFEIYVQRDGADGPISFKRSIVEEVLGSHAIVRDGKLLGVKFSDQDFGDIDGAEEEDVKNLCFDGGGDKFMQAIWEVAERTKSYIFWIDEPPNLAVTSEEALSLVPEGIIESIGPAKIVRSGRELSDYIASDD